MEENTNLNEVYETVEEVVTDQSKGKGYKVVVLTTTLCLAVGGLIYAGVKHMPKLKNAFNRHKDDTVIDTEAEFTNIEE